MTTKLPSLHPIKRHIWTHHRLGYFADWRMARKARLVMIAIILCIMLVLTDNWLNEMLLRLDAEAAHRDLIFSAWKDYTFGMLTRTDYIEGTQDLQVRKPK